MAHLDHCLETCCVDEEGDEVAQPPNGEVGVVWVERDDVLWVSDQRIVDFVPPLGNEQPEINGHNQQNGELFEHKAAQETELEQECLPNKEKEPEYEAELNDELDSLGVKGGELTLTKCMR